MRKKILWAVDAFPESRKLQATTLSTLRMLAKSTDADIFPVYLLSPDQLNLRIEFSQPWIGEFLPSAEKALNSLLAKVKMQGLQKSQVLIQPSPSLRKSVEKLVQYAKENDFDLITLATHGRKGISRMVLGSFAETLFHRSPIPTLIVSPLGKPPQHFKKILFPTDFSEASLKAFQKLWIWAKDFGARITVFHKIPNPVEPVFQSGVLLLGGGWVPIKDFLSNEKKTAGETARKWCAQAQEAGVATDFILNDGAGSTVDGILRGAKKSGATLIAMASESGPIASVMLGSISRQVIRSATCPVWTFRP